MPQPKKRFVYIDALRGFCMLLIIMNHSHFTFFNEDINLLLVNTRVPFFFFLSGLFFKQYSCFKEFFIKKVNHLVVPYFFFSYIPFCLFAYFYTDRYSDILYYLTAFIPPWNTPLWFLRSLFIAFLIYYLIDKLDKKSKWLQVAVIVILVFLTYYTNKEFKRIRYDYPLLEHTSFLFNNLFTAIMALPYFFLAQQVKKRGWLDFKINWPLTILLSSLAFVLAYYSKQDGFSYYAAYFGRYFIFSYVSSLASIFGLGLLLAKIKYTKFLQFIGKNSLIVLGCHALPVIIILENFKIHFSWVFLITLALMVPCIYIFKNYFPKFTAKEDFFKFKDNH